MRAKPNKRKLIIAVFAGIIASFLVLNIAGNLNRKIQEQNDVISNLKQRASDTAKNISQNEDEEVVVAKTNISAGTQFSTSNIEIKSLDAKTIPSGSIKSLDAILGMTANEDITLDSPIIASKIVEFNKKILDIPPGMRAITIPIESIQGFASYISIGTKIDIVSMEKSDNLPDLILQNVRIIAFETGAKPASGGNTPSGSVSGITILAPANGIPRLVGAIAKGKLQLVTRNEEDNEYVAAPNPKAKAVAAAPPIANINPGKLSLPPVITTPAVTLPPSNLSGLSSLPAPATPPRRPPKPPKKVELIQANVKTDVTFDN
jgi:Flp pilus assembly protein CpaB